MPFCKVQLAKNSTHAKHHRILTQGNMVWMGWSPNETCIYNFWYEVMCAFTLQRTCIFVIMNSSLTLTTPFLIVHGTAV